MQLTNATTSGLDLGKLINPGSIAIIGASADPSGHAGRTLANLTSTGYQGEIFPVNPRYEELAGRRCYASVADLPAPADTAYLLLRADRVLGAVRECADRGHGSIVVCASGFAELGAEGKLAQDEIRAVARQAGIRVLGPNCIGIMNVLDNVIACPTFNITTDLCAGGVSIVSQSGGMGVNLTNRAQGRGIGVRALISTGNECDIELAEVLDSLIDDPFTTVVALVIEQLRAGRRFTEAARRARQAGKAVVALKIGKSAAGQRAALGHTGAMAGEYAVFRDVLRQLGVIEAGSVDELLTTANLLARAPAPAGNRLLVVSPSGGECGYVADKAIRRGLVLPELPEETASALAALTPLAQPGNPYDCTGQVIGDSDLLRKVLRILADDDSFDMLAFAIPTWGPYDAERLLGGFTEAAAGVTKPAVISAWTARNLTERAEQMIHDSGVPGFASADEAVDALASLHRYWSAPAWEPAEPPTPLARPDGASGRLTEHAAKQLLAAFGLPVSRDVLAVDHRAALAAAGEIGWPVVAKLQCAGLAHKSDLGLVRTGLTSPGELVAALGDFDAIAREKQLTHDGYLICEQVRGLEFAIGAVRDPSFGPVVMISAGGVLIEQLADKAFRLCPVTSAQATAAAGELRITRIARGARGASYDTGSLAGLVALVSGLFSSAAWMRELDLNPVIVGAHPGGGVTIVDALIDTSPQTQTD